MTEEGDLIYDGELSLDDYHIFDEQLDSFPTRHIDADVEIRYNRADDVIEVQEPEQSHLFRRGSFQNTSTYDVDAETVEYLRQTFQ